MEIEKILSRVPDYRGFFTVDELESEGERLAREFPDVIERFSIGKSRAGDELWALKLGKSEKNALCYACPHPNEPIGAMTIVTLARLFAEDAELLHRTGMSWTLIPCIDPDGTRLNEGWFKGPYNVESYVRGFYRPAGRFQVEWTFPLDYKGHTWNSPIPETKALMSQIEALRPSFVFSLHNCAFGGAYWYINENHDGLCEMLEQTAMRQNIPLYLGEPEGEYVIKRSKAVHSMMSMRAYYDWRESQGKAVPPGPMSCGTCGVDFIETVCDSLVLMAELPYFLVEGIDDGAPVSMKRRQALLSREQRRKQSYARLGDVWRRVRPLMADDNPFPHMVDGAVKSYSGSSEQSFDGAEYERAATKAEALDCLYTSRIFEALDLGLALRACQTELERAEIGAEEKEELEHAASLFDAWIGEQCGQLESGIPYRVAEISRLVKVQIESALHALQFC